MDGFDRVAYLANFVCGTLHTHHGDSYLDDVADVHDRDVGAIYAFKTEGKVFRTYSLKTSTLF